MISITLNNFLFIKREVKYFADKPVFLFNFLTTYIQTNSLEKHFGFKRIPKFTKVINLTLSNDEIFNGLNKTTKNEVQRSERDDIKIDFMLSYDNFKNWYDQFAELKKLAPLHDNDYFKNNIFVSTAYFEGKPVVCHAYLLDEESKIARLLYSVSHLPYIDDKTSRGLVGRVNKYLHYKDMLYFKKKNYLGYDFGGYAFGTSNSKLQGINKFKDSFGGELVEQSNYIPFLIKLLLK
jgi:lipid II:glycine glycyltransferase (peptidoglycan interpeptide bridge formation enzyme)